MYLCKTDSITRIRSTSADAYGYPSCRLSEFILHCAELLLSVDHQRLLRSNLRGEAILWRSSTSIDCRFSAHREWSIRWSFWIRHSRGRGDVTLAHQNQNHKIRSLRWSMKWNKTMHSCPRNRSRRSLFRNRKLFSPIHTWLAFWWMSKQVRRDVVQNIRNNGVFSESIGRNLHDFPRSQKSWILPGRSDAGERWCGEQLGNSYEENAR